jgi:hypothetical protein
MSIQPGTGIPEPPREMKRGTARRDNVHSPVMVAYEFSIHSAEDHFAETSFAK